MQTVSRIIKAFVLHTAERHDMSIDFESLWGSEDAHSSLRLQAFCELWRIGFRPVADRALVQRLSSQVRCSLDIPLPFLAYADMFCCLGCAQQCTFKDSATQTDAKQKATPPYLTVTRLLSLDRSLTMDEVEFCLKISSRTILKLTERGLLSRLPNGRFVPESVKKELNNTGPRIYGYDQEAA